MKGTSNSNDNNTTKNVPGPGSAPDVKPNGVTVFKPRIIRLGQIPIKKTVHYKEDMSKELPHITVLDPVTHDTWEHGRFSTYQIHIRTAHPSFHLRESTVRRRFSELLWLDSMLRSKNRDAKDLPQPPPKRVFSDRFSSHFLRTRAKAMEKYLNELLQNEEVLSDNAFHLFVQTDLTTTEMCEYFKGILPESLVLRAWSNMGHLHTELPSSPPPPQQPQEISMNEEDVDAIIRDTASPPTSTLTAGTTSNNNDNNSTISALVSKPTRSDSNKSDNSSSGSSCCSSVADSGLADVTQSGSPVTSVVEIHTSLAGSKSAWSSIQTGSDVIVDEVLPKPIA